MTATFTFCGHTAKVTDMREVKRSLTGKRPPERIALVTFDRRLPGLGWGDIVRMADIRVEATR